MQKTAIEWTRSYRPDGSFTAGYSCNPIRAARKDDPAKRGHACIKVSGGCKNCYASSLNVWRGTGLEYTVKNLALVDVELERNELRALRRLKSGIVFVCDMTDLFADFVPDAFLNEVFGSLEANTRIRPLILTKRAARMQAYLRDRWGQTPPDHIGVGVSTEDQATFDERVDRLRATPAKMRYISAEPLLGPIFMDLPLGKRGPGCISGCTWGTDGRFHHHPYCHDYADNPFRNTPLDWVIVGGESGASARAADVNWYRSLRDQCAAGGVDFTFKQHGSWIDESQLRPGMVIPRNARRTVGPGGAGMLKVGKKNAGRLLDDEEHNGVPETLRWKTGSIAIS